MRKLIHFCYFDDSYDHFAVAPFGMSMEESRSIVHRIMSHVQGPEMDSDWTEELHKQKRKELEQMLEKEGFQIVKPYRVNGLFEE